MASRLRPLLVAAVACAVAGGCAGPATTIIPASTAVSSEEPHPRTPPPVAGTPYAADELAYFSEIALGAEFGDSSSTVRKWTRDVRIAVHGNPTDADLATLEDVLGDLNALIDPIELSVVRSGQNVDLYFAPESDFSRIAPEYIPVNMGFFWTWWDSPGDIDQARVLISTTRVTQAERSHLIREELTQMLGLMNDSYAYPDSIFYQDWTETAAYSSLDEAVIVMLYSPGIEPGMDGDDALAVLGRSGR